MMMMEPTLRDAIKSINPDAAMIIGGNDINDIRWLGNTPPISVSDIQTELDRLKAEYATQEYARNRASAFPSIEDQLDMQYHDQIDGTTTWKDAIAKVKLDNPKPE